MTESDKTTNPFSKLAKRSTIYQRHEKRLAKTYALQDDPRSAPVRVLSGLPGLRLFFEPYVPDSSISNDEMSSASKPVSLSHLRRFEKPFVNDKIIDDLTIFNPHDELVGDKIAQQHYPYLPHALISGCAGGLAEAVFGRSRTDELNRASRQIALSFNSGLTSRLPATYRHGGFFAVYPHQGVLSSGRKSYSSTNFSNIFQTPKNLFAHATSAGILFGSNAYFRAKIGGEDEPFSSKFILSSGLTGIVTATVFTPLELVRSRLLAHQLLSNGSSLYVTAARGSSFSALSARASLTELVSVVQRNGFPALYKGAMVVYPREIIGNIAYFSTYELFKSYLSDGSEKGYKEDDHHYTTALSPTIHVMLSGGFAGVAYWSLVYPLDTLKSIIQAQSISKPRFQNAFAVVGEVGLYNMYRGYLSCVARAAPANAVLFLGYETMLTAFSSHI